VTSDIHTRPCVPGVWNSCNRSDFREGRNWEEREKRKGIWLRGRCRVVMECVEST